MLVLLPKMMLSKMIANDNRVRYELLPITRSRTLSYFNYYSTFVERTIRLYIEFITYINLVCHKFTAVFFQTRKP